MDQPRKSGMGRRAFLATGAKMTTIAAFCVTFGTTVLTACVPGKGDGSSGDDSSGYGYGFGDGYGS